MINSYIYNTKISGYNQKNYFFSCVNQKDRRFNNPNNDNHILHNIKQKNDYNNHRFYSNNEKDENNANNLSEMRSKLKRWIIYKSNSKDKKEENNSYFKESSNFKTNNHNYHNTNLDNTYHSYEKKSKPFGHCTFDINNISNNIKLIEFDVDTLSKNKNNNFVYQKNYKELSKKLNSIKNRDNYGYHEIKEVKKSYLNHKNNQYVNTEKKNTNNNASNCLSINIRYNNSFRNSLNINNKTNNQNNPSNTNYINNVKYNNYNNAINLNKNINSTKYSLTNFKTAQNYFNPPKNVIKEESNCSSYKNIKNIKDNHKEYKIDNSKKNNNNLNQSSLIRKIYTKNNEEEKKKQNFQGPIIKRNNRNFNNQINKENDKNSINSYRFLSNDLKDIISNEKNKDNKIIKTEKKNNSKIISIKINKPNSPNKVDNSQSINHTQKDSYSGYFTNSTDKKYSKQNSKYEINQKFKNIEKNNIKNFTSSKLVKNEKKNEVKIPNAVRINENILKKNSYDKNNNSFLLKNNHNVIIIKENNKEKLEKNQELNSRKINITSNRNNDIKDHKNNSNKNKVKIPPKKAIFNNTVKKYNNPFNNPINNKSNFLTEDKNKLNEIIKKKCKSTEKNERSKDKDNISNKPVEVVKKHRTRTKTKSKAKKHSDKIKYLDKLKTFKYSETNYSIYYDSSTNSSNNIDYNIKKYALKLTRSHSKKKKNINYFNLNYKTFEDDFKINPNNINEKYQELKPQLSVRITLSKKNNVNIVGILRYFKVNYFCSENLRNKYDIDSEDTSEFYNAKF